MNVEPVEIASSAILERQKLRCYNGSMQKNSYPLADLTDAQLLSEVKTLAAGERDATARLIASLAELDVRRLYLGEGFRSLFTYCTQCLHLSEHAAYNRIEAARVVRKWPTILEQLCDGSLTLTTVSLLARHLTEENHRVVLDAARHKSKREVEEQVAGLQPRPDVPATVRKLPAPKAPTPPAQSVLTTVADAPIATARGAGPVAPRVPAPDPVPPVIAAALPPAPRPAIVAPLAPERYKVQFTVSRQTHDKLRRVQDLMRHAVPNGDPAEIFDRALTLLVEHLERTKLASAKRPRVPGASATQSRHIPSAVKRAVWHRDAGRCAFVGAEGRCTERGFLEFHHVVPYACGGAATEENIYLRCRAHNQHEAEAVFGRHDLFVRKRPPGASGQLAPDRALLTSDSQSTALLRDSPAGIIVHYPAEQAPV
jgi:5-methylcytosine-specific restriction endonuclease McrA